MLKQFTILMVTVSVLFIISFSFLYVILKPASEDGLLKVSSESVYNAPAIKTKLDPINSSMSDLLGAYHPYRIVSTNKIPTGLIVILEELKNGLNTDKRNNVLCILTLPNPSKGQFEAVSRCWRLNEETY